MNPADWWDKFKNGNNSKNVALTNQANMDIANQNIALQRETNAQNEALMREQWAREDNAYQRTAEDMRNAGINVLAMNGTNDAGQVVENTAPQNTAVMEPYQEATSDFQVLGTLVSSLQNLAANDEIARHNAATEEETKRHDEASENEWTTKVNDIKGAIKEGVGTIKGMVHANPKLEETISDLEEQAAGAAKEAADLLRDPKGYAIGKIGNGVLKAKNAIDKKKEERTEKKAAKKAEEEEKKRVQKKANEYYERYYRD